MLKKFLMALICFFVFNAGTAMAAHWEYLDSDWTGSTQFFYDTENTNVTTKKLSEQGDRQIQVVTPIRWQSSKFGVSEGKAEYKYVIMGEHRIQQMKMRYLSPDKNDWQQMAGGDIVDINNYGVGKELLMHILLTDFDSKTSDEK